MKDLVFRINEEEGILVAVCEDPDMATQAEDISKLREMIVDLIDCHLDDDNPLRQAKVRLHFDCEPVIA